MAVPAEASELESFLDNVFLRTMDELHVPGAVFVLVKDGNVFFRKGYGYADLNRKNPVDPDKTMFRVASVSKLITVTGVMQLYERGLLDLNADINQYLTEFKIPQTFPQPITAEHLITHTAGFDDNRVGLATLRADEVLPLGAYLARALPPRIRPPGKEYSYSRHGIALAGYLVETISGRPFPEYVRINILEPLSMKHSTFLFPHSQISDLAQGYRYEDGKYHAVPYYYFQTAPEAAFNSTALDMAHFMIAQLQSGSYEGRQLLEPTTTELMHTRHFGHDNRLPGIAYGFYERNENGLSALQHGGHIPGFVSRLILLPEQGIGIFMACNSGRFKLLSKVTEEFFDHYFPYHQDGDMGRRDKIEVGDVARFAGTYRINEFSHTGIEKIFSLKKQFRISATHEGVLLVRDRQRWLPVEPLVFQNASSGELSVFREDKEGGIVRWYRKRFAFEKIRFYDTVSFHILVFGVAALIFVIGTLVGVGTGAAGVTNFLGANSGTQRWMVRMTGLMSGVNLVFLSGLAFLFLSHDRIDEFTFGVPPFVLALLTLPLISVGLALINLLLVIRGRKVTTLNAGARVYFTALILTSILFLVELNYWNLLGYKF